MWTAPDKKFNTQTWRENGYISGSVYPTGKDLVAKLNLLFSIHYDTYSEQAMPACLAIWRLRFEILEKKNNFVRLI